MNYEQFGFSDNDFGKLYFPVHKVLDGMDLFKVFKILERYPIFNAEIHKNINRNKLIRYIVLAFDINSPIREAYNDFHQQRVKAAIIAGFKLNKDDTFPEYIEEFLMSRNSTINFMVLQYISFHNNDEYTTWVTYREALNRQRQHLFIGDTESEKTKDIMQNIEFLQGKVTVLKERLMGTLQDERIDRSLYEFVESESLGISPEEIAELYNFNINNA